MITVNDHPLTPTLFPDGTSQVWKLPSHVLEDDTLSVDWRFEGEREIMDMFSLKALSPDARIHLYIPFLPYARQDKKVSNDATFNLTVFAYLLNKLRAVEVECLDAHNQTACFKLINNFKNIRVDHIFQRKLDDVKPDVLVFPDLGAQGRYKLNHDNVMVFDKTRNQATGEITGHRLLRHTRSLAEAKKDAFPKTFLIVDDICDGGATFISVAKAIREKCGESAHVVLMVSHGIFSRGLEHLYKNGINEIYTTDSIRKNEGLFLSGVFKV